MKSGQIIDATFVPVPIQRNNKEDNATIKAGQVPAKWDETPNKRAHKDVDARWTKKGGVNHYGYKDHINVDAKTKLIEVPYRGWSLVATALTRYRLPNSLFTMNADFKYEIGKLYFLTSPYTQNF